MSVDPQSIKIQSESEILRLGGHVCDWLPVIGQEEVCSRSAEDVAKRALVLNALVNISFGAPPQLVSGWLKRHKLFDALSPTETEVVNLPGTVSTELQQQLRWNIEGLWAAAWLGGFVDLLGPTQPLSGQLAEYFPSLKHDEGPENFLSEFKLRSVEAAFEALDLFYRAHWFSRNCQLTGASPGAFNLGVVMHRRKFLEWTLKEGSKWDEVELST